MGDDSSPQPSPPPLPPKGLLSSVEILSSKKSGHEAEIVPAAQQPEETHSLRRQSSFYSLRAIFSGRSARSIIVQPPINPIKESPRSGPGKDLADGKEIADDSNQPSITFEPTAQQSYGPSAGIVRNRRPPPLLLNRSNRDSGASFADFVRRVTHALSGNNQENQLSAVQDIPQENDVQAASGPVARSAPKSRFLRLPRWIFFLIIVIIIIIVVVSVVVPIQVTQSRKNQASTASTSTTSTTWSPYTGHAPSTTATSSTSSSPTASSVTASECAKTYECKNSGTVTVRSGQCACICIGGFSGSHCDQVSSSACGVVTANNTYNRAVNLTLGTQIVPMFSQNITEAFPAVSLDAYLIYEVFKRANVTCKSQNALMTFSSPSRSDSRRARRKRDRRKPRALAARKSTALEITYTVLNFAKVVVLDVIQTEKSVDFAEQTQTQLQSAFEDQSIDVYNGTISISDQSESTTIDIDFLNYEIEFYD
ncbi:uncharacterized protein V1516DRAFT_685624 [Lipomyces oligophaga]|uniref:uncharacterized protein n=1 Tax=Lipomyces oligophaga TaxID=45792 RepID=UPI0034CD63E7